METRKVAVLSTAHIAPATLAMLGETPLDAWPMSGGPLPFGFYVYCHDENPGDAIPPEMWQAMKFCAAAGCDYIQYDADAEQIGNLPVFES